MNLIQIVLLVFLARFASFDAWEIGVNNGGSACAVLAFL